MEQAPVRILAVDDHWVGRQGLRMFLDDQPGFTVVGEATDGAEALWPSGSSSRTSC